ncbi:MAG: microcystin-dependent protein [Oceanicoccus sp.]|jgi:microcystin-dependent protein
MSDPFIGEIRMFASNFAPRSWAFCDGKILVINQNQALYSLLGTTYGGDGRTTFGLPDIRGRIPVHTGTGPGLPPIRWGQKSGGTSSVQVTSDINTTRGIFVNKTQQPVLNAANNQPSMCINFIIALNGIFPSRN